MSDLGGMPEGPGDGYGDFGVESADVSGDLDGDFAAWEGADEAALDGWEPTAFEGEDAVDYLLPEENINPESDPLVEEDLLPKEDFSPGSDAHVEEDLFPEESPPPEVDSLVEEDLLPEEAAPPVEEPVEPVEPQAGAGQSSDGAETPGGEAAPLDGTGEPGMDQPPDSTIEQPEAAGEQPEPGGEAEPETETVIDAAIDGDTVAERLDRASIWDAPPQERGHLYEELKEANIDGNYPSIDAFDDESGVATSYKTIDLNAPSYAEDGPRSAAHLKSTINTYTDSLSNFEGAVWNQQGQRIEVPGDAIEERVLCVGVPAGSTTPGQVEALEACKEYAAQRNVTLRIEEVA